MTPLFSIRKNTMTPLGSSPPRRVEVEQAAASGDPTDAAATATARAIIEAGKMRRGEITWPPAADLSETAKAIINAGRARRGEEPLE